MITGKSAINRAISLLLAVVFLSTNTAYSSEAMLRVPLQAARDRMSDALHIVGKTHPSGADGQKLASNEAVNSAFATLDDVDVSGKTVLVRPDLNTPAENGHIKNPEKPHKRIVAASKTIKELAEKNAKVVVVFHQGRLGEPDFMDMPDEHAAQLEKLIGRHVKSVNDLFGREATEAIKSLQPGEILVLKPVRAQDPATGKELEKNPLFVSTLGPLVNLFVLDGFSVAHRDSPSVTGFKNTPTIAGRLMETEVNGASQLLNPKKPHLVVVGGGKIAEKITEFESALTSGRADKILVGGRLANLALIADKLRFRNPDTWGEVSDGELFQLAVSTVGDVTADDLQKSGELKELKRVAKLLIDHRDKIELPIDIVWIKENWDEGVLKKILGISGDKDLGALFDDNRQLSFEAAIRLYGKEKVGELLVRVKEAIKNEEIVEVELTRNGRVPQGFNELLSGTGPKTNRRYAEIAGRKDNPFASAFVIGPLGDTYYDELVPGTRQVLDPVSKIPFWSTGGGDTEALVAKLGLEPTYTSLAGGALAEFKAGKKLPGVELLATNHPVIMAAAKRATEAMRTPVIGGNWKMKIVKKEDALSLLRGIAAEMKGIDISGIEIIVAPSIGRLDIVSQALKELERDNEIPGGMIKIAAQNVAGLETGELTGRTSVVEIKELGASEVIIGHSEQRRDAKKELVSAENEAVNDKVKLAIKHGLRPILCVGESEVERNAGRTNDIVLAMLKKDLAGLTAEQIANSIIAYEPVWAIGTGKTATPQQAQEVLRFIRRYILENFGEYAASKVRIIYGGSVKPDDIAGLMDKSVIPDNDGALVGGASLKADSFAGIIKGVPVRLVRGAEGQKLASNQAVELPSWGKQVGGLISAVEEAKKPGVTIKDFAELAGYLINIQGIRKVKSIRLTQDGVKYKYKDTFIYSKTWEVLEQGGNDKRRIILDALRKHIIRNRQDIVFILENFSSLDEAKKILRNLLAEKTKRDLIPSQAEEGVMYASETAGQSLTGNGTAFRYVAAAIKDIGIIKSRITHNKSSNTTGLEFDINTLREVVLRASNHTVSIAAELALNDIADNFSLGITADMAGFALEFISQSRTLNTIGLAETAIGAKALETGL